MENDNLILNKTFDFAVRIVNLHKYISGKEKDPVLSRQILRSGTSIGANVHEAEKAQSLADFYSKMSIALKEANETFYWLKLLCKTEYLTESEFISMNQDLSEIIGILTAICKSTQIKIENAKK
ncbi:MAG: four helix bundle protein [Ruminococcaceae bacterium]|nr:four helix bundle protein [Oscillospiraceae bacterium]